MAFDGVTELTERKAIANRRWQRVFENICQRILDGEGSGHGACYRPWLPITRRNTSPDSNQVSIWMPPLGRTASYLAKGEYRVATLLLWLGCTDLREQYPIWPVAHPNPLEGAPFAPSELPWSRGLLKIAAEAEIKHGNEFKAKIPYVATIDLLATDVVNSIARLFVFSLKPIVGEEQPIEWRTAERLELERRYSREVADGYRVVSSGIVPHSMASNLEQWMNCSNLTEMAHLQKHVEQFTRIVNVNRALPARDAVKLAADACAITTEDAWVLLRHCAWHQYIDVDPGRPFLSSYPLQAGGIVRKERLRVQMFVRR